MIDPNTRNFLDDGFSYFDEDTGVSVAVPCDDANWCEYQTYNEGFRLKALEFPFSLKLRNSYFKELRSYGDFLDLSTRVIRFRSDVIKRGWAIKYRPGVPGERVP